MYTRVNFYLEVNDDAARLHVHEIQQDEPDLQDEFMDSVVQLLIAYMTMFAGVDIESELALEYGESILEKANRIQEEAKTYPFTKFAITHSVLKLPNDIKATLQFIGGLDGFLLTLIYNAKKYEMQFDISYDAITNDTNLNQYCVEAFRNKITDTQPPKKLLTRYIAETLLASTEKNGENTILSQEFKDTLKELVSSQDPSLSYQIRKRLVPDTNFEDFIEQNDITDPLYQALLNPDVTYLNGAIQLMLHLKAKLANIIVAKKGFDLSETDKENNNQIIKDIDDYINQFAKLSQSYWEAMIKSLYGLPAVDGGLYCDGYTEITLIFESTFTLNEDHLMELNYKETDTYKKCYAKGQENYDILEHELRQAYQHLGLHFVNGIDFHDRIIFDRDSTNKLLAIGLHYSVDYLKSLMREMHHVQLLRPFNYPLDVKCLLFSNTFDKNQAHLQTAELTEVAKLKIKP